MTASAARDSHVKQVLTRCWLVTHLAALAGATACLWSQVPSALLAAWSSFVLLNVLLHQALRGAPRLRAIGLAQTESAMAALLGLACGLGVALLLPYADNAALAALLSAALVVALVAIPVLGEQAAVYPYFLVTLGLLTIAGLFHAHHASLILWVALAMATLALLGHVYGRSHHALRVLLLRLLQIGGADSVPAGGDTHQLFKQAERSLNELTAVVDRAARQRQLLHSLGDALLTTSATGNIDYVNAAAESLLDMPAAQLLDQPLEECVRLVYGRDPRNRTRDIFEQARLSLKPQAMHDQPQLDRRDGVAVGVDYLCTPLCASDAAREKHPHDLAAIVVMLKDLLADELTLAIAIGGEPDPLSGAQCLANGAQFLGLVTPASRPRAVEALRPKKNCRPALPGRHNVFGFKQVEQMTLGGLAANSVAFAIDTFNFSGEPASPSLPILQDGSTNPLAFTATGLGDTIRDPDFQWYAKVLFTPSRNDDETGTLQGTIEHLNLGTFSVSALVDLSTLGQTIDGGHFVFFGFTTSNGAATDEHHVTSAVAAPVPVPAALWLLGSALGGLGALRRRTAREALATTA